MAKVDLIDYSEVGDFLSRVYTSENALEDISVAVATRNKKVLRLYLNAVIDKSVRGFNHGR